MENQTLNTTEYTNNNISDSNSNIKNTKLNIEWLITLLLAFFLGCFGLHRFYNGKIGTGILMIFTFGGFGIWILIDLIMIVLGKFKDDKGEYISVMVPA